MAQAEAARLMRIDRMFADCALPERWRNRTFAAFAETTENADGLRRAKDFVERFPATDGRGLMFVGPVGTGKTHLAAAITLDLVGRGHHVVYGTASAHLAGVRATFDDPDGNEAEAMSRLTGCELLVVDELGKENATKWTEQVLFDLINARYEAKRPMVVTTNYGLSEIRARYPRVGEAVVDRLLEICHGVPMPGTSWRRKIARGAES